MSAPSATDASKSSEASTAPTKEQQKPTAALEEDDEFEDFPAEGIGPLLAYGLHAGAS